MLGTGFVVLSVCLGAGIVIMVTLLIKEVKELKKIKDEGSKEESTENTLSIIHPL